MAKSILSSMVNAAARQIGRDTARVITNNMYGDAHAVPHRAANSQVEVDLSRHWQQINSDELSELTPFNVNEWCSKYGCTYIKTGDNSINYIRTICCIILCTVFNIGSAFIFGSIILIYRAYVHYKHKKYNHERYVIEHPFIEEYTVIDNRSRSGFKTNKRPNTEYFEIPTYSESFNDWCKKEAKLSKIYITLGTSGICIFICILIYWYLALLLVDLSSTSGKMKKDVKAGIPVKLYESDCKPVLQAKLEECIGNTVNETINSLF